MMNQIAALEAKVKELETKLAEQAKQVGTDLVERVDALETTVKAFGAKVKGKVRI